MHGEKALLTVLFQLYFRGGVEQIDLEVSNIARPQVRAPLYAKYQE